MAAKKTLKQPQGDKGDPFAEHCIAEIFRCDPTHSNRLITRESSFIEFKRNFNLGDALNVYGRTIAAFANANGGYLVFGVGNRPRTLDGMSNDRFERIDPTTISAFLNEKFSPEISWAMRTHSLDGNKFGLIYIWEADRKPVIAKANGGDRIKEGEIYYRYRGRTQTIRFPELRRIIDEQHRKEQELWLRHLQRIASIGVQDAAIFSPEDGTVTGRGGTFVIDKDLLNKLQFVREGEFKEVTGTPAIRIVGEAQILAVGKIAPSKIRIQPAVIRGPQIIEVFLKQQEVETPFEFIREICFETSAFFPVYYFIHLAQLTIETVQSELKKVRTAQPGKKRLLKRLSTKDTSLAFIIASTGTQAARRKTKIREDILIQNLQDDYDRIGRRYLFQVIRSLKANEINRDYIFLILKYWYEKIWEGDSNTRSEFRKTVCHIDHVLYGQTTD